MRIKPKCVAGLSLMVSLSACVGCRPGNASPAQPEQSKTESVSAASPLSNLRSHSGGYLKQPNHKRVIVFVNGIFGDAISTWQNSDGNYWPQMLANDPDFKDVDIYVHSFDSPKIKTAQDIDELAGRMNDVLIADGVLQSHDQIVFICHSMGGLVTRAFLLKLRPLPSKVPMIYFFATPTTGANVTEIARHLSNNEQLRDMLPLKEDGYVGDLQNAWLATSTDPRLNYPATIASFCAYEKLDTYGVRIVERQSATNLCNRETRGIVANHIDIVKPSDNREDPYLFFKAAYDRTFGQASFAIDTAVQSQKSQPWGVLEFKRDVPLSAGAAFNGFSGELILRRVKATRTYIAVDCEQTKTDEITAHVDLRPGETIFSVTPTIENLDNISKSSVALVRFDNTGAVIQYSLRGLDRNTLGLNCPGGGHADIVANFVVSQSSEK